MKIPSSIHSLGFVASALVLSGSAVSAKSICNALTPYSFATAATQYPELKPVVDVLKHNAVASWYTDSGSNPIADLLLQCQDDAIPSIVVYGIPKKDCGDGGFSQGGANTNADLYKAWIQTLVNQVGQREVIYVLEPDALGLIASGGCGVQNGYMANLKVALALLASNPNAHIYADVASWADPTGAVKALNELKSAGRLAGIAINTSNFQSTSVLNNLCGTYSAATGGLHCVFDVARNFNGSPQNEWCNAKSAGMGSPPTADTGNPLVDYHLWIKVPGESDGQCTGRSTDAMIGPGAGQFFYDSFKVMWDQGYFVKEKGLPTIGGTSWPSSSTASPTVTPTPVPTTAAPSTAAPSTTAPLTSAPSTPSVSPSTQPFTAAPTVEPSSVPTTTPCHTREVPPTSLPPVEVAQAWAQCGGSHFNGPTTCTVDFSCKKWHDGYSQCVPTHAQANQVDTWGQCGGKDYSGSVQCKASDHCQVRNDYYHQCVPI
ncbi:Aste57867_849 [Aphanomyces stellatus]|uniref:Aste57867_849 protein n=1 Tax=Aphanomyces stellatus TaxID=120398 RepID=A0A485K412_9STRA|nr:hypothetical protein As57867_000848 [Aphanomyces stellatus]VFT78073.1 Aste57867_849 [Aphanomyces stellatus]